MGVFPGLDFENIMLFNCLGYNFNIYGAFEFLCNSIANLWRHERYHYNTLGYPVIIISKVIDISCNGWRNVLLNSYIIDRFAVTDFNTRNKFLTQKLLKQSYRYHKLRKRFSKFYRRYYDLISKFQVGLKSLLRQGLSEPDFYGDLVYKLKKIVGSNNFSAQFIKIISHYKKIGYNINVLQQTACLVVNPITVGNFAFLFNCMPVGRTSDSMMVPT